MLKLLRRLTVDAWEFWLLVILMGLILFGVGRVWSPSEQGVRIVGMCLQLAGLITILIDVSDKQVRHQVAGLIANAYATLQRLFQSKVTVTHHLRADSLAMGMELGTPKLVISDESLDSRVRVLETKIQEVTEYAEKVRRDLDQEVYDRKIALDEERDQRKQVDEEINETIKRSETGGLHLSLFGIIGFAWGIALTSIPTELASAL